MSNSARGDSFHGAAASLDLAAKTSTAKAKDAERDAKGDGVQSHIPRRDCQWNRSLGGRFRRHAVSLGRFGSDMVASRSIFVWSRSLPEILSRFNSPTGCTAGSRLLLQRSGLLLTLARRGKSNDSIGAEGLAVLYRRITKVIFTES